MVELSPSKHVGAEAHFGRLFCDGAYGDAQYYVKQRDYESLRRRFEKACARITELESAQGETRVDADLENLLRDIAANGKRDYSIRAHQALHRLGLLDAQKAPAEPTRAELEENAEYYRLNRDVMGAEWAQLRQLLIRFVISWENLPGHENIDRLCEIARGLGCVPSALKTSSPHSFDANGSDV